jgi:multiple sugar transport system substrate-binding protein
MSPDTNKFKIILSAVFGFFIILGLLAFSTFKSSSTANTQTEISVWGTVDKTVFDNFISKYKQDQILEFKLKYIEKSADTIDGALVEAIATGQGPDAILIPQELMKRYLDKVSFITSIPERTFKDTYIQEAEMYIRPEGIFAIPFFVDPIVMYWNRDTLTSAGIANPPKSWSELPLLASALSKSDNNANIIKSAASLGEYRNVNNAKALLSTFIMQAGSSIIVPATEGKYKSSLYDKLPTQLFVPAVSALSFYTDYSNPKKSVYSWNRSLPSAKQFFLSGDLALYFGFVSEAKDLAEKNPNLNFDVAMIPQTVNATTKVTFGELYGFAFLKSSPNAVVAYNLISMLTSPDAVKTFLQFYDAAPARRDIIAAGNPDAGKTVFYNSALIAKGWVDPDSKKTDVIFQTMVEDTTTGKSDVDGSVQKASLQIDNLLQ